MDVREVESADGASGSTLVGRDQRDRRMIEEDSSNGRWHRSHWLQSHGDPRGLAAKGLAAKMDHRAASRVSSKRRSRACSPAQRITLYISPFQPATPATPRAGYCDFILSRNVPRGYIVLSSISTGSSSRLSSARHVSQRFSSPCTVNCRVRATRRSRGRVTSFAHDDSRHSAPLGLRCPLCTIAGMLVA